ncbi:MAG TPA: recombinase RecA [Anaerolineales bacterium]|nr:recombinase RecA [Anaerolineales bacterium]
MSPRKSKAAAAEEQIEIPSSSRNVDGAKRAVLDKAVGDILKRYGDGSIVRLGEAHFMETEVFSTGSLSLDIALGVGGLPRGRVTEIYGPEGSGKTTVCLHTVAEAQKLGGVAAFIDMEHALDPVYAARVGVDIDNLLVSQPDTGEQALEITETLVRSGGIDVVVIDSVAALVPRAEIEGDMGDATMGVQARLMSQALRKLSGAINQTKTAVIFTNQLRQKIGVMFGNPETTTGGQALKFYASVRLDVRRIQAIKVGDEVIGNRTRVKVVKNKVAPPFRTAEFDIMFNEGISKAGDVLDLATKFEVVQKRGAFFSYGDIRLGQGRENAKDYLRQNPDLMNEIEGVIRQKALSGEIALPLEIGGDDSDGGGVTALEEEV